MTPQLGDSVEILATPGTQMDGTAGQFGILRALVLEDGGQVMAVVVTAAGVRLTVPAEVLTAFPVNRRIRASGQEMGRPSVPRAPLNLGEAIVARWKEESRPPGDPWPRRS